MRVQLTRLESSMSFPATLSITRSIFDVVMEITDHVNQFSQADRFADVSIEPGFGD